MKKDRAEFELREGDLLVCEGGEIGRCAVWHNELQPCFFQKALHRVRCNHQIILPDYLAWWFRYNCDYGGFSAISRCKSYYCTFAWCKIKAVYRSPYLQWNYKSNLLSSSLKPTNQKLQCGNIKNLLERRSLSWK